MEVLVFVCWYYPIGMYRKAIQGHQVSERHGLIFLLLESFFVFTSIFLHMVIAGVEMVEVAGAFGQLAALHTHACFLRWPSEAPRHFGGSAFHVSHLTVSILCRRHA